MKALGRRKDLLNLRTLRVRSAKTDEHATLGKGRSQEIHQTTSARNQIFPRKQDPSQRSQTTKSTHRFGRKFENRRLWAGQKFYLPNATTHTRGGHSLVQSSGNSTGTRSLHCRHRHVVCRLYHRYQLLPVPQFSLFPLFSQSDSVPIISLQFTL